MSDDYLVFARMLLADGPYRTAPAHARVSQGDEVQLPDWSRERAGK